MKFKRIGMAGGVAMLSAALMLVGLVAPSSGSTTKKPSGTPYEFMIISGTGPTEPGSTTYPGAVAAVDAINADGGIRHHPIKIIQCDDHGVPADAAACATSAAKNKKILGTIGNNDYSDDASIIPVLVKAGKPQIALEPYLAADYSTAGVFTVDGGGLAIGIGEDEWMAQLGLNNITALVFDNAGGQGIVGAASGMMAAPFPKAKLSSIYVPVTTSDMSTFAEQIVNESPQPNAVVLALTESLSVGVIQDLRTDGYTGAISAAFTSLPNAAITPIKGSVGTNLYTSGVYAIDSPGYTPFAAAMKKYQPSAQLSDESVLPWIGAWMVRNVMDASKEPMTSAGIMAALNKVTNYSTGGLTPNLDFAKPTGIPGFGRAFNFTSVLHLVNSNGVSQDVKPVEFLDPMTGKESR